MVPLLLHCITLPAGSDTFWKVVQEDFQHTDWKVRFTAGIVELILKLILTDFIDSNISFIYHQLVNFFFVYSRVF